MQSFKYIVDEIPPSNNKYIGRNARWQYNDEKARWESLIYYAFRQQTKDIYTACLLPLKKSRIEITYFFKDKRRRDPDNYSGKFILDGLRKAGVIVDDSFNNIELVLKADVDSKRPRTEIVITEIN